MPASQANEAQRPDEGIDRTVQTLTLRPHELKSHIIHQPPEATAAGRISQTMFGACLQGSVLAMKGLQKRRLLT